MNELGTRRGPRPHVPDGVLDCVRDRRDLADRMVGVIADEKQRLADVWQAASEPVRSNLVRRILDLEDLERRVIADD